MSAKSFVLMLVAVLVLVGALAGSFVGGLVLGQSQEEPANASQVATNLPAPGSASSDQPDLPSFSQIQQQLQSGELSQDELAELRQQFQGQSAQDGGAFGGGGFAGGGGLIGTLESVDDGTISLNTPQGTLKATLGSETVIQQTAQIGVQDLVEGMRLTVVGERAEDGTVEATTIIVVPEGSEGFGGAGFGGRGRGGTGGGQFGGGRGGGP